MGKQWQIWVERLENWLQRWKQWGEGKMMPRHVKHAWNIGKAMEKWPFWLTPCDVQKFHDGTFLARWAAYLIRSRFSAFLWSFAASPIDLTSNTEKSYFWPSIINLILLVCCGIQEEMTHMWCAEVQFLPQFCKQCNLHAIINNEQMREYDVKQWDKNGKAMENLSRNAWKIDYNGGNTEERVKWCQVT